MENVIEIVQMALALSVAFVWIFRFDNVVKEFKQFGLNDLTRNLVGASKIALATLLFVGVWFSSVVIAAAVGMGIFMIAAQYFHFSIKNPFIKRLPSLILLLLCVFIVIESIQ